MNDGAFDRMIYMTKRKMMLLTTTFAVPVAYETGKAGWKMDGDKIALDGSGNPIYVNAAGQEMTVDQNTISNLNREAKTHREAKEAAEASLNKYRDGNGKLIDPTIAVKAVDTVSKMDAKQLIDAGEVDKVRDQVKAEFTGQLTERDKAIEARDAKINDMTIGGVFANSEFIRENLAIPRDMFEAAMRPFFKVEDGKPVAYDRSGNKLMSKARIGEYADPDEALSLLVDMHPQKDAIIRAPSGGGTGNGGGGGNRGGGRTMKRADFDQLGGADKAAAAAAAGKGELTIAD